MATAVRSSRAGADQVSSWVSLQFGVARMAAAREGVDYSVRLASKRDEFLQAKGERTMLALIKAIVRSRNDTVGPQNVRAPAEKTGTKDKERKQRTDGKTAHRNRARDQEILRRRSQPDGEPAPRTNHHM